MYNTQVGSATMRPTGVTFGTYGGSGKIVESITVDVAGRITALTDKLEGTSTASYFFHEAFYNQTPPFAGGLMTSARLPGIVLELQDLIGIDNTQGNYSGNPVIGLTTGSNNVSGTVTGATLYQPTSGAFRVFGPVTLTFKTTLGLQGINETDGAGVGRFGFMCPVNETNKYTEFPYVGLNANTKPKHGVYFEVNGDGLLLCVCRKNNVQTVINAGAVLSSYNTYEIITNRLNGAVDFKVNGNVVATIEPTNVPIAYLGIHFQMLRWVTSPLSAQMYIQQYFLQAIPPDPYF